MGRRPSSSARFFSILRVTAAWMAGVSRMRWWTFFFWNAAGGICWAVLVGLVAYYAGHAAADAISRYGLIGGVVIAVARSGRARRLPLLAQAAGGVAVKWAFVLLVAAVVCSTGQSAAPQVPAFDHVVVVVLENKERGNVLGNPAAPAFNAFARQGAVLTGYRGVTHPSLPNYLALVSGSTHGISSDCTSCTVGGRSLADTLEARKLTWKAYAEGLPRAGVDRAVARPLREEARAVPLLPARPRTAGAPTPGRAADAARARPRGRPPAQLLARRPGSLPRHARLLGRDGRRVAEALPAAAAEAARHGGLRRLRRVRHAPTRACPRSRSARSCEPTRTRRAR